MPEPAAPAAVDPAQSSESVVKGGRVDTSSLKVDAAGAASGGRVSAQTVNLDFEGPAGAAVDPQQDPAWAEFQRVHEGNPLAIQDSRNVQAEKDLAASLPPELAA